MRSLRFVLAAAMFGGACAPAILKTPVTGPRYSISRLAGEWEGDYDSRESGRRGVIRFRLRSGADTAEGDVVMQLARNAEPSAPDASPTSWEAMRAANQVLSIRFVFVAENVVSGVLNPYRDPECGCALTTTFRGTITGDVIEGTFHTEGAGFWHMPTEGRWRVRRRVP